MKTESQLAETARLPAGYRAAGVHCGVKRDAPDLALFVSDAPATVAGMFTTNRVQAACVQLCRQRILGGAARAIVINSGNANACTGEQGWRDAERMAAAVSEAIGVPAEEVFMSSTGPIGNALPMDRIEEGIPAAAAALSSEGGAAAARAMMTTDTEPKYVSTTMMIDGAPSRLTGIAKGSGMIHPNMATMLAYLFTDAAVAAPDLQKSLSGATTDSFNRITVDGDHSTNDTVLLLANGASEAPVLTPSHSAWAVFDQAVRDVTLALARRIVKDGEGATRLVTIRVTGAANDEDADRAARSVGNSLLCKTSWAGGDPNWSRVLCAVGYSGAELVQDRVDIDYNDTPAARGGSAVAGTEDALRAVVAQEAFTLHIDLHAGSGSAVVYACDTTEAYIRINVEE